MIRVNILSTKNPNYSLIFTPIFVNKNILESMGVNIKFFDSISNELFNADCVIINNRIYRKNPNKTRDSDMFNLLEKLNKKVEKVYWLDTTDGTGTTQFQFLPYVSKYFKTQILKDKNKYLKKYYGGRIFTDYYHKKFHVNDSVEYTDIEPAKQDQLHKIEISWGHCLADFGKYSTILRKIRKFFPIKTFYSQNFINSYTKAQTVNFRFNANYSRETISFQRNLIQKKANEIGYSTNKIPRKKYFSELKQSKLAVSPFGWGETSYKDFEIIINGVALIKPDMSHMSTWPEIYIDNFTYLPINWDCSNLSETIEESTKDDKWQKINLQAQELYKKSLYGEEAEFDFSNRFINMLN